MGVKFRHKVMCGWEDGIWVGFLRFFSCMSVYIFIFT